MSVEALLSRLDKVRRTGAGKWQARCPGHDVRGPSLSVRELEDGRVLVHDFGGCAVEDVLTAVGLTFDALYPEKSPRAEGHRGERRPWIPSDVLEIARLEVGVVFLIACDMHKSKTVSEQDYQRLLVAAGRLEHIAKAAYGR